MFKNISIVDDSDSIPVFVNSFVIILKSFHNVNCFTIFAGNFILTISEKKIVFLMFINKVFYRESMLTSFVT